MGQKTGIRIFYSFDIKKMLNATIISFFSFTNYQTKINFYPPTRNVPTVNVQPYNSKSKIMEMSSIYLICGKITLIWIPFSLHCVDY